MKNCSDHNARACHLCAPLRHPSQMKTRKALAAAGMPGARKPLPVEMDAENGGTRG